MTATPIDERLTLDSDLHAAGIARRWVLGHLGDCERVERDDALLVTSELVTNAVLHGLPPVVLEITCKDAATRISVSDGDDGPVGPKPAWAQGPGGGRGLMLVASIAAEWGVIVRSHGKTVWAEIARASR